MNKRKFQHLAKGISDGFDMRDKGRYAGRFLPGTRHLLESAEQEMVDDFDAMFGQMIDDGEAELVTEVSGEIIMYDDGILIWMANGSCCFCDKFEFSSKNQMQAAAA